MLELFSMSHFLRLNRFDIRLKPSDPVVGLGAKHGHFIPERTQPKRTFYFGPRTDTYPFTFGTWDLVSAFKPFREDTNYRELWEYTQVEPALK